MENIKQIYTNTYLGYNMENIYVIGQKIWKIFIHTYWSNLVWSSRLLFSTRSTNV